MRVRKLLGRPVVVAVIAVGLFGASCAQEQAGYDNVPKPSIDPNKPVAPVASTTSIAPYTPTYAAQVPCKVSGIPKKDPNDPSKDLAYECGTLTVPEDRSVAGGTELKLQVVRIKSSNPTPSPDPVIYLEGGPGGSALVRVNRWVEAFAPILKNRDLLIMDQRGTGYSEPTITCTFDWNRATQDTEELEVMQECYERISGSKFNLAAYNTAQNAADFADLRIALAIPEWNLFGISYGTRLALQIMGAHPEGVRSVVLDSVFPSGVSYFNDRPANATGSFQAVFAACAADPGCNATNPDLENGLAAIVDELNKKPFRNNNPFEGDGAKYLQFNGVGFLSYIVQSLYDTEAIHYLPSVITYARKDPRQVVEVLMTDPTHPLYIGDLANPLQQGLNRASLSDGFFFTVMCAEEAPKADPAVMDANVPPVNPILKAALIESVMDDLEVCKNWTVPASPVAEPTGEIPSLVMSGTFDPITPPVWGLNAQSKLPKSRNIVLEGAGHGVYLDGTCIENIVDAFLTDPAGLAGGNGDCPPVTEFFDLF